jgi:hypothetical protein
MKIALALLLALTITGLPCWAGDKKCTLVANSLPAVRGLRLGMPVEELENRYKGMKVPLPNPNGYTEIVLFVEIGENIPNVSPGRGIAKIKRQSFPEWVGVEKMILSFVDGHLADYTILYTAGDPDWRSSEEFAASVTSSFGIPLKTWKKWGVYAMYLECSGFRVEAKVENYAGHNGGILQVTDTNALSLLKSRRDGIKLREKNDAERRKRIFKP